MPTLSWLTRKHDIRRAAQVPHHALLAVPEHDTAAPADNWLVQGDNLLALKALRPYYAGKVKCVFIDPPYNTGKDFEHYDDNLKHTQWLEMMYPRLQLLRDFLAEDGSIWVIIDDDEGHYLKVLMDEIFGRKNFVANVVWQKKYSPQNDTKWLSDSHDHILCYAKNKDKWRPYLLPRTEEMDKRYTNPDSDSRGLWKKVDFSVKTYSLEYDYAIKLPSGRVVNPPTSRCWCTSENKYKELVKDNRIWFGKNGNNVPSLKKFLSEVKQGTMSMTIWGYKEVGHNQDAKQEVKQFLADDVFATPKPERLLQRVLHLATQPGDLVLDSFLGSGTTAAVAHKMGRRWIGVEMGDHAVTHCLPRLRAVVDGEQGGVSKQVQWSGGGGFRFLRLGGRIFTADGAIDSQVDFPTLAAYLWFDETHTPLPQQHGGGRSPFLGVGNGVGVALLYNGILRDKSVNGGNVLTGQTAEHIRAAAPKGFHGKIIVYANACRFGDQRLSAEGMEFKQIPYDCAGR